MAGNDASNPNANRAYAAAHFALELDGKDAIGVFRSVEGGGVKADVMTYQPAPNLENGGYQRWRQLGKPKYDDIKVQVGMAMSAPFYNWCSEFFTGKGTRKSGAIVAADFHYNERARRSFFGALIKELTFPKLDAADKNAVYMGATLAVEDISFTKGTGKKLDVPKGMDAQKMWTACNFELKLDGFAESCRRVTKIDSFTVKQNIAEYHGGGFKNAVKTPTAIEYPNIVFYLPEADAQPFMDYFHKQVGFGSTDPDRKKGTGVPGMVRDPTAFNGHIITYDNQHRTLLTVELKGCDILSVAPEKSDASSEDVKLVKIELYTESLKLTYPGELA